MLDTMQTTITTVVAAYLLLAAPGPTNVLFAASGAAVGLRRSLWMLPAALVAYLISITILVVAIGPAAARQPWLGAMMQIAAAAILLWSGYKSWRHSSMASLAGVVTPGQIFWTTFFNPKVLIFAFGLFPNVAVQPGLLFFFIGFALFSCCWLMAGQILAICMPKLLSRKHLSRAIAIANAFFAVVIAGTAVRILT